MIFDGAVATGAVAAWALAASQIGPWIAAGTATALVALYLANSQREGLIVKSAQGAVTAVNDALRRLQEDLTRSEQHNLRCEAEVKVLRERLTRREEELVVVAAKAQQLDDRVKVLEAAGAGRDATRRDDPTP